MSSSLCKSDSGKSLYVITQRFPIRRVCEKPLIRRYPGNGMAYASLNDGGGGQPDRRGTAEKARLWRAQGRIRQEEDS